LFKQRAEIDYLTVEREKKSYYRANNNEEDGGDLQQISKGPETVEKRFAYVWRAISLLMTSSKFSISGREVGEGSPF